jgi:hypothetical protein
LAPTVVEHVDALAPEANKAMWQKFYSAAGYSSAGEESKAGLRLAVYLYLLVNGTSREGAYSGDLRPRDGNLVPAATLVRVCGSAGVRRWMRANQAESYDALRAQPLENIVPRYVASVAKLNIGTQEAFATADWLTGCEKFTPTEVRAHETSFDTSVNRARRARGGHALEEVEKRRQEVALESQGPLNAGGTPVNF